MAITKAQADVELVDRAGGLLSFAGRSVLVDGTNPDTVGALRAGLASLDLTPAVAGTVTDVDLAQVDSADLDQLYDVAELRLKRNLLGWMTLCDQKISLGEQKLSQVRDSLLLAIKDLEAQVKDCYGIGGGRVSGGAVDLGFAQTDPCDTTSLWGC